MASKLHDGTASSFLDAMIKLGPNPNMGSVNAHLSSFSELSLQEQDAVIQSPKYWDTLASWSTEEDREEMARRHVERLKEIWQKVANRPGTRKSAAARDEAVRLLTTIPKEGKFYEYSRALVCKEDPEDGSAAGKAGSNIPDDLAPEVDAAGQSGGAMLTKIQNLVFSRS